MKPFEKIWFLENGEGEDTELRNLDSSPLYDIWGHGKKLTD